MLDSYFFIPANQRKFIENRNSIKATCYIFDLEDSVLNNELDMCLNNLKDLPVLDNYFVRLRFFDWEGNLNEDLLNKLIKVGFKKFLIPKFSETSQLEKIYNFLHAAYPSLNEFKFILIIEHPSGIVQLNDTLKGRLLNIIGIGLGSHDYCNVTGMKHSLENLNYSRQYILNSAKAFNIEAIDIASMNLSDTAGFTEECKSGFDLGYDGKFIIHPWQLNLLQKIKYYSDEEVAEAETIYNKILSINEKEKPLIRINNKLYERPHINRILKIIKWKNNYESK